jgi:hypothetical protein
MRKLIQLKLYSLLSTKWGTALFVIGLFFTVNSLLQIMRAVVPPGLDWNRSFLSQPLVPKTIEFYGKNVTVSETPCVPEIDIVYTWVNGSDPVHVRSITYQKNWTYNCRFEKYQDPPSW